MTKGEMHETAPSDFRRAGSCHLHSIHCTSCSFQ